MQHVKLRMHSGDLFVIVRFLRNITIPAVFIQKTDGDALKQLVSKNPTGQGQEQVIVVMDWTDALPKADKVEWEFWTNSNDQCGAVCDVQKEFIKVRLPELLGLYCSRSGSCVCIAADGTFHS